MTPKRDCYYFFRAVDPNITSYRPPKKKKNLRNTVRTILFGIWFRRSNTRTVKKTAKNTTRISPGNGNIII